jgi:anti-sigma B factor antagonist
MAVSEDAEIRVLALASRRGDDRETGMEIERLDEDDATIVTVRGVIKLGESASAFSSFLGDVLDQGRNPVLIDLEGIDYVDSTGLGELVGHLQRFEAQGRRMAFVNPARRLRKLFELTRLEEVVPIYDDLEQAKTGVAGD